MTGYILILVFYSIFHSAHTDIKRAPVMFRPIGFGGDGKIDAMRIFLGLIVLISFVLACTLFGWTDVLIYTLSIRFGVFILLTIIPLVFPPIKQINGLLLFFSFILTIIAVLYFIFSDFILKN